MLDISNNMKNMTAVVLWVYLLFLKIKIAVSALYAINVAIWKLLTRHVFVVVPEVLAYFGFNKDPRFYNIGHVGQSEHILDPSIIPTNLPS